MKEHKIPQQIEGNENQKHIQQRYPFHSDVPKGSEQSSDDQQSAKAPTALQNGGGQGGRHPAIFSLGEIVGTEEISTNPGG